MKLAPSTTYRLTVFRGTSAVLGVRAFDGGTLVKNKEITFRTTDGVGETDVQKANYDVPFCAPPAGEANAAIDRCIVDCTSDDCFINEAKTEVACAPSQILEYCTGCHGDSEPRMGLSLSATLNAASKKSLLEETAFGKVAHQTQIGGQGDTPTEQPQRFGVAMPIIAPNEPGNSYLIYKALAQGVSDPREDEQQRLRDWIVGMPMPPANAGKQLARAQVRVLSEWILSGAPVAACSK
jgi:hypothetical protein